MIAYGPMMLCGEKKVPQIMVKEQRGIVKSV